MTCTANFRSMMFSNVVRQLTYFTSYVTVSRYFGANVGKLSYLLIILMGHTMVVNIQYYFLSLDLISNG